MASAKPAVQTVAVIGEALVDVVHPSSGGSRNHPGGSPANVAIGLARLGWPVELVTRIGTDDFGSLLRHHLVSNGVSLPCPDVVAPSNLAEAFLDGSGAARYEFRIDWALTGVDDLDLHKAGWLHTGSIAGTLLPGADRVRALVEEHRGQALVSYDPNCRPSLMGDPATALDRIEHLVGLSDVVKASDEDLAWLYPDLALADVAAAWLKSGPAVVVVTRGARGSIAVTRDGQLACPARSVAVDDTVGAGDSFMAALISGIAHRVGLGAGSREVLRRPSNVDLDGILHEASAAAAINCARPGAQPPTASELASYLRASG